MFEGHFCWFSKRREEKGRIVTKLPCCKEGRGDGRGEERRGEEGKELLEVAVPRPTYSLLNCNIEDTA